MKSKEKWHTKVRKPLGMFEKLDGLPNISIRELFEVLRASKKRSGKSSAGMSRK